MGQGIERLGKISGREAAQLYFVAGHLGFQGRKTHQPEGQCRTRNPAGVSRLGGCTGMWEGHLRAPLDCGAVWGEVGQGQFAVNMVERQRQGMPCSKVNQLACHVWRKRLATFVVTHVSLRAAEAFRHGLLGDTEALSDGLEVVHAQIVAPLGFQVNSAGSLKL